jgi:hypothetical protein
MVVQLLRLIAKGLRYEKMVEFMGLRHNTGIVCKRNLS